MDAEISNAALPINPPHAIGFDFGVNGILVPAVTERGHLTDPRYWQHIAPYMSPRDVLHIQSEAGLFYVVALVRSVSASRTSAEVIVLSSWEEPEPEVMERAGMKVEWRPGGWTIVMSASGITVKDKLDSRTAASALLQAMTAQPTKGAKAA